MLRRKRCIEIIYVHAVTWQQWWRQQMETFTALLALLVVNSPLNGEFPIRKASDAELWCFPLSGPEQTVDQTIETPVILDAIVLIITSL